MTEQRQARWLGVVLAGGEGRRMGGRDKGALELDGALFAERVTGRLRPLCAGLVVAAPSPPAWMDAVQPAEFVADHLVDDQPVGPAGGLLAALAQAGDRFDGVATAPVDVPNFPADMFAQMARAAGPDEVVLAQHQGQLHPTFGLWPTRVRGEVERLVATKRLRALHRIGQSLGAVFCEIEAPAAALFNVNTPDDLDQLSGRA